MGSQPRDIYIPVSSWEAMVDVVAPKPRGMDPFFVKAVEPFSRYAQTLKGELGEAIQRCQDHLDRYLKSAQEIVQSEAGDVSGRLGRLRDFKFGDTTLAYKVFAYRNIDSVSIREDRLTEYMSQYDLFRETMRFMEKKVETGNLGILKNSFVFIHKPLSQAAEHLDVAYEKLPIDHTTIYGEVPSPDYVDVAGDEPNDEFPRGTICRILKHGYAFEGREIQGGVVTVSSGPAE